MVGITVEKVSKAFGAVRALEDVSLAIEPGEIFFLLGPSGCGKTTLLRIIAGLCEADRGRILFDGEDVTPLPAHRRGTAMMFQSYALWPHMNVRRNVAFGLEERKLRRAEIDRRVEEALQLVHLEDYGDRSINALSGGQQQRVALARALVVRPSCLLLDEPLSNLDAKLRLEMRREIRRICKDHGLTAVCVTHDQKEALSVADRLAIIEDGLLRQTGTPREVYTRPARCSIASLIGEVNFIEAIVRATAGDVLHADSGVGPIEARLTAADFRPGAGAAVVLAIRPESLRLTPSADAGPNAFAGEIVDRVYLGETVQYDLRAVDGSLWQATELNPLAIRRAGDQVAAQVRPEDVVALPPPEDPPPP